MNKKKIIGICVVIFVIVFVAICIAIAQFSKKDLEEAKKGLEETQRKYGWVEKENIDDEIKVDFHFIEAEVSTIFVYKKNNSYYIEQPYNGIYQISGDEYNSIEKLVR